MNPSQIAEEFRLIAAAHAAMFGIACINGHSSAAVALPRAVFRAKFRPLNGSATIGTADISIAVETHAGDCDAVAESEFHHRNQVNAVRAVFFGQEATTATARAVVAMQIGATGRLEVDPRYLPAGDVEQEIDGDRLRTTMRLRAGVMLTGAV